MNFEGIETIVWDLDGTLLDSFGVFSEVTREVLQACGYEVPIDEVMAQNFHGTLEDSVSNAAGGIEPAALPAVMEKWLAAQNHHYEDVEKHLFADALELTRRAKAAGKRQTVVTNRAHAGRLNGSPRNIIANSSLQSTIDNLICGDDGPHRKPLVEVFGGKAPTGETTLVIGDQYVDIMFAHNLGAQALIVNRGSQTLQHIEKLHDTWQEHTVIVETLDDISFS